MMLNWLKKRLHILKPESAEEAEKRKIDRRKQKEREASIAAKNRWLAHFSPKSIPRYNKKNRSPRIQAPFIGHIKLAAIFEYLQRLTLSAGLGALAQIIITQKISLEFGEQARQIVSWGAGALVGFAALFLSLIVTLDLIQKLLPKRITFGVGLGIYVSGSVFILVSMILFQAAVYSLAKKDEKPKPTISVTHGTGEGKIEVLIVGDQNLNETVLTIKPKEPDKAKTPQATEDPKRVD